MQNTAANRLEQLDLVNALTPENRKQVLQKGRIISIKARQTLTANEQHRWLLYLMEGKIELICGEEKETISAYTHRAKRPIFETGKCNSRAVMLTNATLLRLDWNLYQALWEHQRKPNYEVEDIELSEREKQIFFQLFQLSVTNDLRVPVFTDRARRVLQVANTEKADASMLARSLVFDMGLAVHVLRVANKPLSGNSKPVMHLGDAVSRLGSAKTLQVVQDAVNIYGYTTQSTLLQRYLENIWKNSTYIATLSYAVAKLCNIPGLHPERAMMAGLLADIGKLPIIEHLIRFNIELTQSELDSLLGRLSPMVGELVANSWLMEADVACVIRESYHWHRRTHHNVADYCDIVLVARFLYHILYNTTGTHGVPPRASISAFQRLSFDMTMQAKMEKIKILKSTKEEAHQVADLLGLSDKIAMV